MEYHYVYIIVSKKDRGRHYVGCTSDVGARLRKHNEGGCPHTSKFKPWVPEVCMAFVDKAMAVAFEAYLKSGSGASSLAGISDIYGY
jgi:predicted GIY-YIG superfamily endonuclease